MTPRPHQTYLARALNDGHAVIAGEGRSERIRYIAADRSERWSDPEEKVRAELWAELIYKYDYSPERMGFEVTLPDRTPTRYADLVIYCDDELKSPYFVFECKKGDVSDAEFDQSIEQAVGNRNLLGASYCGAVAGLTRRLLRFDGFSSGERERNHLTDIPVRYGSPSEWRFYKNRAGQGFGRGAPGRPAGRHPQVPPDALGGWTAPAPSRPLASFANWCSSSTGMRKT